MPEDAVLIEGDAPLGREISGDARPRRDAAVKRDRPWVFRLQPLHPPGESIAQTRDHLEKRNVRVGKRLAEEPAASFAPEHPLEVAEEFRQALGGEVRGAALRFGLLVLVVEGAPDRVVRVVRFDQPVGHRELELVRPEAGFLAFRHQAVARGEPEEDVRRLRDHELPRLEERRRVGHAPLRLAFQEAHQHRNAAPRVSRDIDVFGSRFLQREPHEFSAALYRRPVIELVAHAVLLQGTSRFRNRTPHLSKVKLREGPSVAPGGAERARSRSSPDSTRCRWRTRGGRSRSRRKSIRASRDLMDQAALRSVNASNAAITASSTSAERASDQWMPISPPTKPTVTPEKARMPRPDRR